MRCNIKGNLYTKLHTVRECIHLCVFSVWARYDLAHSGLFNIGCKNRPNSPQSHAITVFSVFGTGYA